MFSPKKYLSRYKIAYYILMAFFASIMLAIPPLASLKDTFPWNLIATLVAIILGSIFAFLLLPRGGGS